MAINTTYNSPVNMQYTLNEQIEIGTIISSVTNQLQGKILSIEYTDKGSDDKNYALRIETSKGVFEKISLFALKENGKWKTLQAAIQELKTKIEIHLAHKNDKNILLLASGALLDIENTKYVSLENALLKIDQKFIVYPKDGKYYLLPSAMIQTYTILKVENKDPLLIITDEHDKRRTDGRSGFIFNLEQPKSLTKNEVNFDWLNEEEKKSLTLSNQADYHILFRNEAEALNFKG